MPDDPTRAHAALVQQLYAGFRDRDLAALALTLAPDACWHVPGRSALAGEYRGLEAILGYFEKLHARAGGSFRASPRAFLGTPDGCLVWAETHAERAGRTLALDYVMAFAIRANRVIEAKLYSEDLYAFDAFWGA